MDFKFTSAEQERELEAENHIEIALTIIEILQDHGSGITTKLLTKITVTRLLDKDIYINTSVITSVITLLVQLHRLHTRANILNEAQGDWIYLPEHLPETLDTQG